MTIMFSPMILRSQKTFFSLGAEVAFPATPESGITFLGTGFGASARIESSWGKHISGIASLGYLGFTETTPYSTTPETKAKAYVIVFQPGIKYYLQKKQERPKGVFFTFELGLMYVNTKFDFASNPDHTSKYTDISLAPGIGYQLGKIETGFRLQFNLGETGYNVYYYNFRVAYAFLKKKDDSK